MAGEKVVFAGVGHHLPETEVSSADVERKVFEKSQFQLPTGLLQKLTGIESRRFRSDDEQASDLALKASVRALEKASIDPADLDVVIFASCTQDISEPATANILQEKLGATRSHVFDVKNACNSFLNGLDVADSLIRAGKARTVLIAVGETLSCCIEWRITSKEQLRTGMSGLTLGDAGAAAVVRAESNGNGRGLLPSAFQTYGDQWRLATVLGGGSMHRFAEQYSYFSGESRLLREQALKHIPGLVQRVLDNVGWRADDIDVACCHQITVDLVGDIAEMCGVPPERCIISVRDCGNTAAASIPLGLSRALDEGRLKPGAKVILVGAAAGFSVGVVPLVW